MAGSGRVPVSGYLRVPEHLSLLTNPRTPLQPDPTVPTVLATSPPWNWTEVGRA